MSGSKKFNLEKLRQAITTEVSLYALAAALVTLPLNFAYGSISCLLFVAASLFAIGRGRFSLSATFLVPIGYFLLMCISLLWTREPELTQEGLQRQSIFLFFPLVFLLGQQLTPEQARRIIGIFSYAMVSYAVYFIGRAALDYTATHDGNVFFFHRLVTLELNAIYVAAFASLPMFFFLSKPVKRPLDHICIVVLIAFIFLLSSKSVFFIDLILIAWYYVFYSKIPDGVRTLTVISVLLFVTASIALVPQVRERIVHEYETAFVDNTLQEGFGTDNAKVYSVSLQQAWTEPSFRSDTFFPGTALRVFQVRIFSEMLAEQDIFFTGFGHAASQDEISKKVQEHNLYFGYNVLNFHNQYVQTFAELGIFGFLLLVAMLVLNMRNACRNRNFLHIVFALTAILLFLTESFFCRQRGIIFFVVLYCIFNAVYKTNPQKA